MVGLSSTCMANASESGMARQIPCPGADNHRSIKSSKRFWTLCIFEGQDASLRLETHTLDLPVQEHLQIIFSLVLCKPL